MIVANIRSAKDLQAKKDLQKQLIDLEVANEEVRQKRQQESSNKDLEAKKIVAQYKTPAEVQKDIVALEKKTLDYFLELGFNYAEAGQLTNWVSGSNKLNAFISNFNLIKKDIQEGYDKSIIDTEFLKNYLENFFEDLEVNLGKKFSKDRDQKQISVDNIFTDLPSEADLVSLVDIIQNNLIFNNSGKYGNNTSIIKRKAQEITALLNIYKELITPFDGLLRDNPNLTQNERMRITRKLQSALDNINYLKGEELRIIRSRLSQYIDNVNKEEINLIFNRISRQLSSLLNPKSIDLIKNVYKEFEKIISTKGVDYNSKIENINSSLIQAQKQYNELVLNELASYNISEEVEARAEKEEQKYQAEREVIMQTAEAEKLAKKEAEIAKALADKTIGVDDYLAELIDTAVGLEDEGVKALARLVLDRFKDDGTSNKYITLSQYARLNEIATRPRKLKKDAPATVADITVKVVNKYLDSNPEYDPRERQVGFTPLKLGRKKEEAPTNTPAGVFGLGANPKLLSKLKKHFKGDEALLKKVAKALTEDSSSDEEESKELSRHIKATDKTDKKIEKLVGGGDSGVAFRATRIPVSKVGKGVKLEKEDNPTYRQFGKYVLHIPYLLNNNTANFKYPSLGSIPTLKPLKISDDYKDLIIETLQTGKLNKKEFERLPQSEIKHFERVVVGAGLVEQLGLKLGNTDEDKTDTKRFELLRGEYLAGNNNADLIKELRHLITKFITNGRIHKNEGLNLLLELSTF